MKTASERLLTFDEARQAIMTTAGGCLLPAEGATLADLAGRVLAEDLTAPGDVPAADNSAMDGYAVRHAEIAGATVASPVTLPVAGFSDAGHPLESLPPGQAAYIATGGLLPAGADTIVKIEDVEVAADQRQVVFRSVPAMGSFVRARGRDMQEGATVLRKGDLLGPFEIGVVASLGRMGVRVRQRPRVAILTSGDELVMPFESPSPWQVRNANTAVLAASIRESGGEPLDLGIVRDDPDRAAAALELAADLADLIVTSGGVSLGRRDPFVTAFQALQVQPVVHGVAMKPGKPLFFGLLDGRPVFGLPGNQASSAVTFQLFVRPYLARMQGRHQPDLPALVLPLARGIDNPTRRDHFLRGTIVAGEPAATGVSRAEPLARQDSHLLSSLAGSSILIRHPGDRPRLEAGEPVPCLALR